MDDAFTFTVTVLHAAVTYPSYKEAYHSYLILDDDEHVAWALDAHIWPVLAQSILEAIHWWSFGYFLCMSFVRFMQ